MFEAQIDQLRKTLRLNQTIDVHKYNNLTEFYLANIRQFGDIPAFTCLGKTLTYNDLDILSDAFAAYIQNHTGLEKGDRLAVQLPNILQQPVVILGAFKAGLVVVNTNPLYTERELEHQLNDSGAKALVVLANVADVAANVIPSTGLETVIVTQLADLHSPVKRCLLNLAVKHIKKMVPDFTIKGAVAFTDVMAEGKQLAASPVEVGYEDIAVLQYTGGTTGLAKGAMLTHGNLLANATQSDTYFDSYGIGNPAEIVVQPLPLYHIFAFIIALICVGRGVHTVLIPNPRDLPATIKVLGKYRFHGICGLNTLFVALCNNEKFRALDFSALKMTLSGGMALTMDAAKKWEAITGCEVYEGYGLTETSPVVSVNAGTGNCLGTVGVVAPQTSIDIRDDKGNSVGVDELGELCVKGPQVMKGYWQQEEETRNAIEDGWFKTGDIALVTDAGYLKIVDRKKDMIIVSGFNVFPCEVEDVVAHMEGVLESAAIGHLLPEGGEEVHLYVVLSDESLTEEAIIAHCRTELTAYKVPKRVFFREELPKSNVGKILRRLVK